MIGRSGGAPRTFVVTGGAGFIGSALVKLLVQEEGARVVSVDALTYAGDMGRLAELDGDERHRFVKLDVTDEGALLDLFREVRPAGVFHLAAETHVDRSIDGPGAFVLNNTVGTQRLLSAALAYWQGVSDGEPFGVVNVSTDEVYGSLGQGGVFDEGSPFAPRSPYSASKAGADHMAAAYFHTFGLPVVTTHASNNYGPFQFPEKLVPLALSRALAGESVPLYGDGSNVRDWLHVDDHAAGLLLAMELGRPGATYLFGGDNELSNRDLLGAALGVLNEVVPAARDYRELVTLVADRPGHDWRYAVDSGLAERELGWRRARPFAAGLRQTVEWYANNRAWVERVRAERYDLGRLGGHT